MFRTPGTLGVPLKHQNNASKCTLHGSLVCRWSFLAPENPGACNSLHPRLSYMPPAAMGFSTSAYNGFSPGHTAPPAAPAAYHPADVMYGSATMAAVAPAIRPATASPTAHSSTSIPMLAHMPCSSPADNLSAIRERASAFEDSIAADNIFTEGTKKICAMSPLKLKKELL